MPRRIAYADSAADRAVPHRWLPAGGGCHSAGALSRPGDRGVRRRAGQPRRRAPRRRRDRLHLRRPAVRQAGDADLCGDRPRASPVLRLLAAVQQRDRADAVLGGSGGARRPDGGADPGRGRITDRAGDLLQPRAARAHQAAGAVPPEDQRQGGARRHGMAPGQRRGHPGSGRDQHAHRLVQASPTRRWRWAASRWCPEAIGAVCCSTV